ncbi:transglycosylase SLT domain-containing protein [Tateyamaria armeniaca]|uniref:Transglycosylase SLT domain-containing protein n=1 Tax=Tateyamaria armeniaca TaxID=2518930 RepID=A0ABW8UXP5_9RHOB
MGTRILRGMFWNGPLWMICAAAATLILPISAHADAQTVTAPVPAIQSDVETSTSVPDPAIAVVRPQMRERNVSATRWTHQPGHMVWNRAALSALKTHGSALVDMVPGDIGSWCPLYPDATQAQRRAFWLGFMSALAKYESTYRPTAVGGGGRWYGLLQILPATARGYQCNVGTGAALKNGAANLSCAVRIMAETVPRDGVIYAPGGRGVAADWGPMRSRAKRADMAGWLKRQRYCMPVATTRPALRPVRIAAD